MYYHVDGPKIVQCGLCLDTNMMKTRIVYDVFHFQLISRPSYAMGFRCRGPSIVCKIAESNSHLNLIDFDDRRDEGLLSN